MSPHTYHFQSEFSIISCFYIPQLFFAFANEEKFSENGWMVYNPMSEYRRQVSYWSCGCLVLSYLTTYMEELLFVHFSYQLFCGGSWEWEKMQTELGKKSTEKNHWNLKKHIRMPQEGSLCSLKEVIDASHNVRLLSEQGVGTVCQICNYSTLNIDLI